MVFFTTIVVHPEPAGTDVLSCHLTAAVDVTTMRTTNVCYLTEPIHLWPRSLLWREDCKTVMKSPTLNVVSRRHRQGTARVALFQCTVIILYQLNYLFLVLL